MAPPMHNWLKCNPEVSCSVRHQYCTVYKCHRTKLMPSDNFHRSSSFWKSYINILELIKMSSKLLDLIDELWALIRETRNETGHAHAQHIMYNEAVGGVPPEQDAGPSVFDEMLFANSNSLPSGSNLGAPAVETIGLVNFCGVFSGNTSSVDNASDEANAPLDELGGGSAVGTNNPDSPLISRTDPDGAEDEELYHSPMVTIDKDSKSSAVNSQYSAV